MVAETSCTFTAGCITILHASNNSNQCSQAAALVYSSRTVWVGYVHRRHSNTMSMCTIWVHARVNMSPANGVCRAKAAKLWYACSRDFPKVTVYLVVQMNLSRWMAVCYGQLTFYWTLDHWQWQSRLENHAITHKTLNQKLRWLFLITTSLTHAQTDYRMPPGLCLLRHNYSMLSYGMFTCTWTIEFVCVYTGTKRCMATMEIFK